MKVLKLKIDKAEAIERLEKNTTNLRDSYAEGKDGIFHGEIHCEKFKIYENQRRPLPCIKGRITTSGDTSEIEYSCGFDSQQLALFSGVCLIPTFFLLFSLFPQLGLLSNLALLLIASCFFALFYAYLAKFGHGLYWRRAEVLLRKTLEANKSD